LTLRRQARFSKNQNRTYSIRKIRRSSCISGARAVTSTADRIDTAAPVPPSRDDRRPFRSPLVPLKELLPAVPCPAALRIDVYSTSHPRGKAKLKIHGCKPDRTVRPFCYRHRRRASGARKRTGPGITGAPINGTEYPQLFRTPSRLIECGLK
jgi:hypothetical protein